MLNYKMHEIVPNLVRVASHLLRYNVISYFHLHVHLQSYCWTLSLGLLGFFTDPTLHSLKKELFYIYIHTHILMLCGFPSMYFSLTLSKMYLHSVR